MFRPTVASSPLNFTLESRQPAIAALFRCAVSPLGANGEFKRGRFG
jgi:hypothetical protein